MNEVVKRNLRKMKGTRKGELHSDEMQGESMGGNAGTHDGHPCMAANFYYEPATGEIIHFGNVQNVPRKIIDSFAEGMLRIVVYRARRSQVFELNHSGLSDEGMRNLEESITLYNARKETMFSKLKMLFKRGFDCGKGLAENQ